MSRVSHAIDRIKVTFDDENLVANAGLLLVGTLAVRLQLEVLVNSLVALSGRVGGSRPAPANPAPKLDRRVHQRLEIESNRQRAHQQQPGIGHQVLVVERHLDPVDHMRYSTHRKCLPG